ncbi:MAG: 3-dehydroquinate synthase [Bacteroidaceae bacterium]
MSQQQTLLTSTLTDDLKKTLDGKDFDKIFILTDENTQKVCFPILKTEEEFNEATLIVIPASDSNKNINTLTTVWEKLSTEGGSRQSLLINLGGGMVTDLGGFAASTFKRGISYYNIPTTLLAMVDASMGGKTGINFLGLKNEIGVFNPPSKVWIHTEFLKTLDSKNLLSGYAEMIKHGLISTVKHWNSLMAFDLEQIDYKLMQQLIGESIETKELIVNQDPLEQGIRKALNLGHTIGHAFESFAMQYNNGVYHGYAVAWGLLCELYLSHLIHQFPQKTLQQLLYFVKENYGGFYFTCNDYDTLYSFMLHDKKNKEGVINFTLLKDIGQIEINQTATKEQIFETFDFYRDAMGI